MTLIWVTAAAVALGSLGVIVFVGKVLNPVATPTVSAVPPVPKLEDIRVVVDKQTDALVAGDEAGWLKPVDPLDASLMKLYKDRFTFLRALGVTSLEAVVDRSYANEDFLDKTEYDTSVYYAYCVQVDPCPKPVPMDYGSSAPTEGFIADVIWELRDGAYYITEYKPADDEADRRLGGPGYLVQPWVVTPLTTLKGNRVTVLASEDLSSSMARVLVLAEAAAINADKFALDKVPVRYIVYVANSGQWKTWYGGLNDNPDVLGYAIPTSRSSDVVVLNFNNINSNDLAFVLRHEFGHVATLLGVDGQRYTAKHFWIEGLAELIAQDGAAVSSYGGYNFIRQFIRSGQWDADLDNTDKYWFGDNQGVVYAMGYLIWSCIDRQYGRASTLDLARRLLRTPGTTEDAATQGALGMPWSAVESACISYIRSV